MDLCLGFTYLRFKCFDVTSQFLDHPGHVVDLSLRIAKLIPVLSGAYGQFLHLECAVSPSVSQHFNSSSTDLSI